MWKDLSAAWQAAFREMWTAFCAGSVPVGAVLCNSEGSIIISDHNRNSEPQTINKRIAHAKDKISSKRQLLRNGSSAGHRSVLCCKRR